MLGPRVTLVRPFWEQKMNRQIGSIGALAALGVLVAALAFAQDAKPGAKNESKPATEKKSDEKKADISAADAGLDKFKALAGEWVSVDDPKTVVATYRVTAAGSAVVETLFPGGTHEMVTIYTRDGDTLLLTHYCAMANQPRMRCKPTADATTFKFEFDSGTNMKPSDAHMHECAITPTAASIKSQWTLYSDGKPNTDHMAKFDLVRKK